MTDTVRWKLKTCICFWIAAEMFIIYVNQLSYLKGTYHLYIDNKCEYTVYTIFIGIHIK